VTWTYDPTDLSTTLSQVRLKTGDTDEDDQLLSDEEVASVTDTYPDVPRASIECIKIILAQPEAARAVDRNGTGFSASRSQRFQHLKDILDTLEAQSRLSAEPTWTGSSISANEALESDTDYIPSAFSAGQFDNG